MNKITAFFFIVLTFSGMSCRRNARVSVTGELKTWHRVTLRIKGPKMSEESSFNPFLDYRLEVTFRNGVKKYVIPGFFAADGHAANTGASSGRIWEVRFAPDIPGTWSYTISFRKGRNAAVSTDRKSGVSFGPDGYTGTFIVDPTDKTGGDFRARGRLELSGGHYLRHAGNGEYFLKGGADSPENFLGYKDFDGTWYGGSKIARKGESAPNLGLHAYAPHIRDWHEGDPQWKDGRGKGIIGALNYLAEEGMNSVYFLTLNILGDGDDVWPYNRRNERYRFDCSKLDQWETVFSHMDSLGLMMHVVLQETENECLLDAGYLDVQRKLYLRELIARFSHHLGITWNLGEEHGPTDWSPYGQTVQDTKKMATFLRQTDPYDHPIVIHTHASDPSRSTLITPYLGFPDVNGPSIQAGNPADTHRQTLKWLELSEKAGHNWIVCLDEIGPAWKGVLPDAFDPGHDTIRHEVLWGNLMAGGAGVEWYFGYRFPNNDLNCEDWRSRDHMWDLTRYALEFFHDYLPFNEMVNIDHLVSTGYCFALPGEIYAVYVPSGGTCRINLKGTDHDFSVSWYDPRNGGELQAGNRLSVSGGKIVSTGEAPSDQEKDWVCLLRKK